MKAKVWLKILVGVFVFSLIFAFGVACSENNGETNQPPKIIDIKFYSVGYSNEMDTAKPCYIVEHEGLESRMYVYKLRNTYVNVVYVKPGHLEDRFGQKIDEKFYKLVSGSEEWTCVTTSQTLVWDYIIYRYDEKNEKYQARAIRVEWEISIVDKPI